MKKSIFSLTLLALFSLNTSVQAAQASDWTFKLTPYGFANSISGTASAIGQNDVPANLDFEQIFNNLDATFMMTGEAVHNSGWGFAVDYSFMDLSKSKSIPVVGTLAASNRLGVLEGLVFKRSETKFGQIDVFGGFRWWDHDLAASLNSNLPGKGFDIAVAEDWVDAVVGVRIMKELNEDWAINARADIGGLGLSSDFTSTVSTGVNYHINDTMTLEVSYKATWVDYNNGKSGTDYYAYDTLTHGPVIGLSFEF